MKKKRVKGLSKPKKSGVQTAVSAAFQTVFITLFIAGLGGMLFTARALGLLLKP